MAESDGAKKIGIIGSGLIGRSWAMLFAAAGYRVTIYDTDEKQLREGLEEIRGALGRLEKDGMMRGALTVEQQLQLISTTLNLRDSITHALYVQECTPESVEQKRGVFEGLDELVGEGTVLASSTSCIPASAFSSHLKHRQQVIVAHPVNPPFYCPLVEVVPAPYTAEWARDRAMSILKEIGQSPILLRKELPGFALNRVQYALLAECWRLVEDDAISVADLDKVMTEGLGMRYAFLGPLQTCHLNAEGLQNYCERYGETISNVVSDFGPVPKFSGATAEKISRELEALVPLSELASRRKWRDERLAELAKLKLSLSD